MSQCSSFDGFKWKADLLFIDGAFDRVNKIRNNTAGTTEQFRIFSYLRFYGLSFVTRAKEDEMKWSC